MIEIIILSLHEQLNYYKKGPFISLEEIKI